MQTVVVAGQKGGGGKTTLVAHLAVAAERAGHGPAVVVDMDPQQTLATWWQAREGTVRDVPNAEEAARRQRQHRPRDQGELAARGRFLAPAHAAAQ